MDKFNCLFQKSTQTTTCQLYNEMSRLVRLYASNLLKPECIVAVGNDLSKLNLATCNQLEDRIKERKKSKGLVSGLSSL